MAAEDANAMAKAAKKAVATASNAEAAETEDAVEADVAEDALENDIAVEAEEAEKDVTVGLYYYTEDGKTVWQGYQHVTAVEGSVVTLTADDLENDTVTVDGVEYTVDAENPKYVDCKVEYAENINEVRWYVPVKLVEEDVTIEKSIVTVKVQGEGIADGADVDSTIDYDDPDTWCILPKVAVKEGWKFVGLL